MANKEQRMSVSSRSYLLAYNLIQTTGWTFILMKAVQYVIEGNYGIEVGTPGLYLKVHKELKLFQGLACLEIIHSIIGIIRSNVVLTFFQIYSRNIILWGIIDFVPVSYLEQFIWPLVVLLVWSISEVSRYIYYACMLIGSTPYFIIYLRYSLFIVLYPVGVFSEQVLLFYALPIVRATQRWSIFLPNPWNFSFSYYYFVISGIIQYLIVFPHLYDRMIHQRMKVLCKELKKAQ
ncbi:PREDICTED: very-long-chain (3R)-3-hydroxyacyl-CoA dehydratase 2-like [Amphimedon queenslandica]|uniref:Very-long-chain (3R)-3-hydroxyacyl-CoA dehydratase n=1 Tax=Amphimedon queenslandica TaxID=400682 RepID=A0AAN0IDY2_AMPQE|nr:PREDICTED: very-long-chain (3R)-3-hydroxyacyl-CoA dehydratase 2-like [Amphimedon queenslandica]|eukprot:XP_003386469.1 PREDICTED: very-long-chain (3R)-3-hydroxyacyl-CoA dehydratase 2-like [Amphimedon queenslandica]